jgi:hypothetical protein
MFMFEKIIVLDHDIFYLLVLILCADIQKLNKLCSLLCFPVFVAHQYLLLIISLHGYFEIPSLMHVFVSHMHVNAMG